MEGKGPRTLPTLSTSTHGAGDYASSMPPSARPPLVPTLSGEELRRWYWLKAELIAFARELGIQTSGAKDTLTARIAATLDGHDVTELHPPPTTPATQLTGPLTGDTIIPAGQRCSRVVREWFVSQVGTGFRFDGAMREFFAQTDGSHTFQDALDHYQATRTVAPKPIDSQFEFNRFTRHWYATHPGGTRQDMLVAWQTFRALPAEQRNTS